MFDGVIQDLVDHLGKLPGIGPKGAQRIAFHLLSVDAAEAQQLAEAITTVKEQISFCTVCGYISTEEVCNICRDPRRLDSVLCIVEEAKDVVAVERTGEFRGRYHVLGGAIDPMRNVGPNDLRMRELVKRLADESITEIILATDNNIEGEATAAYISRLLGQMELRITRLASGLPAGAELDFADEITLGRAFSGRQLLRADG